MTELLNLFNQNYGDDSHKIFTCWKCDKKISIHNQTDEVVMWTILRDHILFSHIYKDLQ